MGEPLPTLSSRQCHNVRVSVVNPACDPQFQALFKTGYRRLARLLYRISGDFARAEEVASEAFWRLYADLRAEGLTYAQLAGALHLNPASIGTLLARAEDAFRKEYVNRHGQPRTH